MTIEIADRLVKLRKKYGYSQEELADKLGLSRQAVSKWERAEASPDTDNLICLAKLYGVSLDELLATDEDVDTIVKEQVKEEKETPKDDRIVINDDGVYLKSKKGSSISITDDGVVCVDKNGKIVKKLPEHKKAMAVIGGIEGVLFLLAAVAFFLLGYFLNIWESAWIVFFVPEIICSIPRAIVKRNANQFNMVFTSTFVFFFVCMMLPKLIEGFSDKLWHPMWVVFIAIPVYYAFVNTINKAIGKEDHDDEENEEDDD